MKFFFHKYYPKIGGEGGDEDEEEWPKQKEKKNL